MDVVVIQLVRIDPSGLQRFFGCRQLADNMTAETDVDGLPNLFPVHDDMTRIGEDADQARNMDNQPGLLLTFTGGRPCRGLAKLDGSRGYCPQAIIRPPEQENPRFDIAYNHARGGFSTRRFWRLGVVPVSIEVRPVNALESRHRATTGGQRSNRITNRRDATNVPTAAISTK